MGEGSIGVVRIVSSGKIVGRALVERFGLATLRGEAASARRHPRSNRGGDVRLSCGEQFDGFEQLFGALFLGDIAVSARPQGSKGKGRLVVERKDQELEPRATTAQLAEQSAAVIVFEAQVNHDQIRFEREDGCESLSGSRRRAADEEARLPAKQQLESTADGRFIVHEEHPCPGGCILRCACHRLSIL
jgi:hypothetical protein